MTVKISSVSCIFVLKKKNLKLENKEQKLRDFAKQEGIAWATYSLTLAFKLEWVQAIRRTIWNFIEEYNRVSREETTDYFFQLEKQINNHVDQFLNTFFI